MSKLRFAASELDCQDECVKYSWCTNFGYNTLTKSCTLHEWDAEATNVTSFYTVAGPRVCWATTSFNLTVWATQDELPENSVRKWETVLKAALVRVAGYSSEPGKTRERVLHAKDISILLKTPQSGGSGPTHLLHFAVRIGASSRNALYFYHMLSGDYRQQLEKSVTEFARLGAEQLEMPNHVQVVLEDLSYEVNGDDLKQKAESKVEAKVQEAFTLDSRSRFRFESHSHALSWAHPMTLLLFGLASSLVMGILTLRKVRVARQSEDYLPLTRPSSPYRNRSMLLSRGASSTIAPRQDSRSLVYSV